MVRWEYKEVKNDESDLIKLINRYGLLGWRYIKMRSNGSHLFERELMQGARKDKEAERILSELPQRPRELVMGIPSNTGENGRAPSVEALKEISIDRLRKTRNLGSKSEKSIVETFRKNKIFIT